MLTITLLLKALNNSLVSRQEISGMLHRALGDCFIESENKTREEEAPKLFRDKMMCGLVPVLL